MKSVGLARVALTLSFAVGCSTTARQTPPSEGPDLSVPLSTSTDMAGPNCGGATYEAHQAPAAMLVLLDRSASMADNNKFVFAAQAIVQAIDQDVFDTMSVGLMAAPTGTINGPACIFNLPVACAAPPFPQVDLAAGGTQKSSDPNGVRHKIKAWLTNNTPDQGAGDATPMYSAIQSAIGALQGVAKVQKRILMVVTDGSWDCTQYGNRPGYSDCNGCDHEWEKPQNAVTLVATANKDAQAPVDTFVVGVPGADTYDGSGCNNPPYHMRAGLSAIAYAGSPANAPANCTGKTFNDNSPDPATSCHFDMTQGNFNAKVLADAIAQVRGKVLGCVFDLPAIDGGMVDLTAVNVNYSIDGGAAMELKKRGDPNNACVADGCWDYTADSKVQLIGKACDDIKAQTNAKVQILVGCPTIIG